MNDLCIYITTYNRVQYLKRAIDSIIRQSYSDFTLIVLDNCSSDDTEKYVLSLNDSRIKYIRHTQNIGGGANINYGFKNCEAKYFCVFHDDDILHENLIEKEIEYMEYDRNCMAVSCLANIINEKDEVTKENNHKTGEIKTWRNTEFFAYYIGKQKNIVFPATMYRTDFIKDNNLYLRVEAGPCADVVLYMDIEKMGGKIAEIQYPLINYRIYSNQDSSSNLEKMLISLISFLNKDNYYSELLKNMSRETKKYYHWYSRRLLARIASKKITPQMASEYMLTMKKEINGSKAYCIMMIRLIKLQEKMPRIFSYWYNIVKKYKQ